MGQRRGCRRRMGQGRGCRRGERRQWQNSVRRRHGGRRKGRWNGSGLLWIVWQRSELRIEKQCHVQALSEQTRILPLLKSGCPVFWRSIVVHGFEMLE